MELECVVDYWGNVVSTGFAVVASKHRASNIVSEMDKWWIHDHVTVKAEDTAFRQWKGLGWVKNCLANNTPTKIYYYIILLLNPVSQISPNVICITQKHKTKHMAIISISCNVLPTYCLLWNRGMPDMTSWIHTLPTEWHLICSIQSLKYIMPDCLGINT